MAVSQVAYNKENKNYEVIARNGQVATFFVFPAKLQAGDALPTLHIRAFKKQLLFVFSGIYNEKTDNLEFFLEGPTGFRYKASLQVDVPRGPYSWKVKRHAHTKFGKADDATMFFVPRTMCLQPETLLNPEVDVVNRWSFYGGVMPAKFGRLGLKMKLAKAMCKKNPEAAGDQDTGLKGYNFNVLKQRQTFPGPKGINLAVEIAEQQTESEKTCLTEVSKKVPCGENKTDLRVPKIDANTCSSKVKASLPKVDVPTVPANVNPYEATKLIHKARDSIFKGTITMKPNNSLEYEKFPSVADIRPKFEGLFGSSGERDPSIVLSEKTMSTKKRDNGTGNNFTVSLNDDTSLSSKKKIFSSTQDHATSAKDTNGTSEKSIGVTCSQDDKNAGSPSSTKSLIESKDGKRITTITTTASSKDNQSILANPLAAVVRKYGPGVKTKKNYNQTFLGFSDIQVYLGKVLRGNTSCTS